MKQVIKDKTIRACVCGRDKEGIIERPAKRRASTWLATAAMVLFTLATILGGFSWDDWKGVRGTVALLLIAYVAVGVPLKFLRYHKKKHAFFCSLRHAFYDIV